MAEAQDEMLQVLKEKIRLEGQLEALSLEASQVGGGCLVGVPGAMCLLPTGCRVAPEPECAHLPPGVCRPLRARLPLACGGAVRPVSVRMCLDLLPLLLGT